MAGAWTYQEKPDSLPNSPMKDRYERSKKTLGEILQRMRDEEIAKKKAADQAKTKNGRRYGDKVPDGGDD